MKALLGACGGAQGRQHTGHGSGLALSLLTSRNLRHVLPIFGSVAGLACAWQSAPKHPTLLRSQKTALPLPLPGKTHTVQN